MLYWEVGITSDVVLAGSMVTEDEDPCLTIGNDVLSRKAVLLIIFIKLVEDLSNDSCNDVDCSTLEAVIVARDTNDSDDGDDIVVDRAFSGIWAALLIVSPA